MRVILGAALALVLATAAQADVAWQTFQDPNGAFSVDFPDQPASKVSLGSNKDGIVVPPGARYMAIAEDVAFVITVTDLRNAAIDPDSTVSGSVKGLTSTGTTVSDTKVSLNGHDGRAITVADAKTTSAARIFSFDNYVFQTLVIAPKTITPAQQAVIDRFTSSFHFSK